MKSDKKKTSIDFETEIMQMTREYTEKNNMSLSTGVNYILYNVLGLGRDTRFKLSQKLFELRYELEQTNIGKGMVSQENTEKDLFHLKNLTQIFNQGKEYIEVRNNMKRIDLKNGYCIIPEDWIVVDRWRNEDVVYPGVIEVKNASRYEDTLGNIPHVLFFQPQPINNMTDTEENYILEKVSEMCPAFNRIKAMQVVPMYDNNNNMLNEELFLIAPIIGFFPLRAYGEKYSSYPYDAVFVRRGVL